MNNFKTFKTIISLILVIVMAALAPVQALAAANDQKYVSEVYVAYGKNAEEAKKTLEDKGFTPVEGNLNDGGKTYSMLGYKTTNNIRDSITDLAAMNMNGDFSVEDYKILLKKKKTEIADFLEEFMAVVQEYRVNLKAGKEKAKHIHTLLNNYTDDDTGMKMGDLLNSETLQDKVGITKSIEAENPDNLPDLVTILMQGNAQVIQSIELLLSMATDTADNTWLDRFAEMDYDALLDSVEDERPDLNTESKRAAYLENVYGETASAFGVALISLRNELSEYELLGLNIETASEEELKNAFGDFSQDEDANIKLNQWLSIGTTYTGLKVYEGGNFAEGELLDFFMEEHDPDDEEIFIPMAAALSEGQRYALPFVSPLNLIRYAFIDNEAWKEMADQNKATFDELESVSVYQNIDRDVYKDDGSVAMTDSAQRANNTADGSKGDDASKMDTLSKITAISWAAAAGSALATVVAIKARDHFVHAHSFVMLQDVEELSGREYRTRVVDLGEIKIEKNWNEAYTAEQYNKTLKFLEDSKKSNGGFWDESSQSYLRQMKTARYSVVLARIMIVATIALAVASTVLTIIDLCRDKSVEQLPIPKYLVDNYTDNDGGSYTLNYKAVECNREEYFGADYKIQKGSSADLNADEGKQWLVLYASKNSKAGKPITPDFVIQESNKAPSGYEGAVHLFGEKGAVNVVSSAFKNYSTFSQTWQTITGGYTMYIFTKLSNDVKTYDEASGNMTASTIRNGNTAIFGFGGMAIGAIVGAVGAVLVSRGKKKKESVQ